MSTRQTALISPSIDFLMIGGLSILFIGAAMLLNVQGQFTQEEFVTAFFVLSFLVNLPHFAATYQLFYGTHRQRILKSWSWKLIGIVIPAIMFLFLSASYLLSSWKDISYMISLMFILVGWHYIKQVFGCMAVTSSRADYRFSQMQRYAVKTNLIALWLVSLTENYRRALFPIYNSLQYPFMLIPQKYEFIPYGLLIISGVGFVALTLVRYQKEKLKLPPITWVPLVAAYFWFLPTMNRDIVFMSLPLFHALQYMLFIIAYKRNEFYTESMANYIKKMFWFFALAFFIGAFSMELIPRFMDLFISLKAGNITIFLVIFNVFINIHHYLMDFLLWRRNVPEFQKYLLAPRP